MTDWFRNTEWNQEIASTFETRLGRSRSKAQYLNIQAYTFLAIYPEIAAELSQRAIALGDPGETARAYLYLGTALAVAGNLDGAINALESAIEAERRNPMCRTGAYLDQALLIALAQREDMYDCALRRLEEERALPFADQNLSALIARTLIGAERGDDVAAMAAAALEALGVSEDDSGALPEYLAPSDLRARLEAIANR